MCIVAIANALQVNLAIFDKVNGEAILISHQCTTANINKTIYLKYSHNPKGKHIGDHYDAIVNIEIPTEEVQSGQQSEERSEVQDCQINTSEENNTSKSKQTEYREEKRGEKRKYGKHSLNLHLFTNVSPVVTDQIPWGVVGTSIYQIKCDEEVWHDVM